MVDAPACGEYPQAVYGCIKLDAGQACRARRPTTQGFHVIETGNRSEMLRGGFTRGLVLSPAMRISNLVLLALLVLAGCSTITVGPCGPTAAHFSVKDEHKSMVIHPLGCYSSWAQEAPAFEAERLALLRCSDTHPDSDGDCKVVATDGSICPRKLESWIKEQSQNKGVPQKRPAVGSASICRRSKSRVPLERNRRLWMNGVLWQGRTSASFSLSVTSILA